MLSRNCVETLEGSVVVGLGLLGNEFPPARSGAAMRANVRHRVNAEPYPINCDVPSADNAGHENAFRVLSHGTSLTGISSGWQA